MSRRNPKKLPKGSYHHFLMTIYDILDNDKNKTSITTREILEKWPGLKKLDEEKDGAVRRRSYMSDKRICGEVAAAASYVGFQGKIFKSRGDIGLGISEKCLQNYDVRASQRWDIPRTKLTS